ncbi:MAG TPA: hypothetical protein ENI33_00405 [Thermoplasmatales archaeon]|nr:hypothetical protein [Thermoplasmatales archaeon]
MIFNCHTHIGDAFIKLPDRKFSIEELVAPPYGYKHVLMRKVGNSKIMKGMEKAVEIMKNCGTNVFIDFREGGVKGVKLLLEILKNKNLEAIILGRPYNMEYNEKEIDEILDISDGIGLSSISDWKFEEIVAISNHVEERGKIFALHASESRREDINKILDLKPNFLVHLCKADEENINEVAKKKIGVVVCPRANGFFGLSPPLNLMMEKRIDVMLGTDNAMIVEPDIIEEMNFLIKKFDIEKKEAFKMISKTPSKFFGEILKNRVHS